MNNKKWHASSDDIDEQPDSENDETFTEDDIIALDEAIKKLSSFAALKDLLEKIYAELKGLHSAFQTYTTSTTASIG